MTVTWNETSKCDVQMLYSEVSDTRHMFLDPIHALLTTVMFWSETGLLDILEYFNRKRVSESVDKNLLLFFFCNIGKFIEAPYIDDTFRK